MADQTDSNQALFCDFENVALGVRESKSDELDIQLILERLLIKGPIIVKKAYCDWGRFSAFKEGMHKAAFELIDIPHLRHSGKNSADIRMVVDALDLCYSNAYVDTFVIISGDSDFSPLVSKLRENAKHVIGVGVKNSTSDLLIRNCDEFIFYDDLVEKKSTSKKRGKRKTKAQRKSTTSKDKAQEGLDLIIDTAIAVSNERGTREKLWGSMVKQTLKRRAPGFSESAYGFDSFSGMLEEAKARGLLDLTLDERSGGYIISGIESE